MPVYLIQKNSILDIPIYVSDLEKNSSLEMILLCTDMGTQNRCLLISTIEMRVFWLEIKCLKSATRLLNRVCVGQQGLDLSKEVLWVSVCQRAAKLPAGKVGGLKKNSAMRPGSRLTHPHRATWQNFVSNLHLCQLVTRLPFDMQRPTVLF